ncbi:MAG: putative Hydrolase CocE/NonD family protein [Candidatus Binatus sp.]|nr:putative Hydrolase CocE/NonD family protein [Candidatus Binatus sp.]
MAADKLHEIEIERNLLIPLRDGAELSADLYRPAGKGSFPTLMSFYPYHKDDFIGAMNEAPRRYFAARGYAHLLIDFRGLGGSSGIAWEAMDRGEGRDGAEAVEWAAAQRWCDGNVGMWGISYGGISSLKTAAENPPHLKAIAPIQGSADIYHDYIYPGGCRTMLGGYGAWGSFMLAMNLMPPTNPDPAGRWYKVWRERLEHGRPYLLEWDAHPEFDEYWKSRVVSPEKITTPTFLIGGWRDIFPEGMAGIYSRLKGPKKMLMGPWMHTLPDLSRFEPVDYLPELKRWFDFWLRGEKTGITDEPPVTIYVQRANEWRHEREWPIARGNARTLYLNAGGVLSDRSQREEQGENYTANPTLGASSGLWDPMALGVGLPLDQGSDDLLSLAYTTDPIAESIEISGAGEATVFAESKSNEPLNLVVKLCDVDPSGASSLITTGLMHGGPRNGAGKSSPGKSGEAAQFKIPLWSTSYRVPKGNRIRVSVSCSDFPRVWPTTTNPDVRLYFGGQRASSVSIPVVPIATARVDGPAMKRPAEAPPLSLMTPTWRIERDLVNQAVSVSTGEKTSFPLPQGGTVAVDHLASARVSASRPDDAVVEGETLFCMQLPVIGNLDVKTTSWVSQHGTTLTGKITVDGRVVFEKRWEK